MTQGFYCLIQYVPDASRAEGANVGLMIFQLAPHATAVRVVEDVQPVMKRLGRKEDASTLLGVVQSMRNRIEHEQFASVEQVERFVKTRGNQIQLTMPRSIRIDDINRNLAEMFTELVDDRQSVAADAMLKEPTLLKQTFLRLEQRAPGRVLLDRTFHVRGLGIPIHADVAYRNGCLNLIREVSSPRGEDRLRVQAMALSREGELARDLEEGAGKLIVVASGSAHAKKLTESEREFVYLLTKLKGVEFVPSAEFPAFAKQVEQDLASH